MRSSLRRVSRRRPRHRPSGDWPQFRNTPTLTGVAASPLPAALKLLWTYEAAAPVESSAAIADGIGVRRRRRPASCIALDVATGQAEVEVPRRVRRPRHRRVVAGRRQRHRLHRRSDRRAARRGRRDRQGAAGRSRPAPRSSRRRSSPATRVLIGSYDGHPLRARRRDRQAGLEGRRPTTTCTRRRRSGTASRTSAAATSSSTACGIADGAKVADARAPAATRPRRRRSPPAWRISARSPTKSSPSTSPRRKSSGASRIPIASFRSTRRRRWRATWWCSAAATRSVRALDLATGKPRWSFATRARVDSSPAIAGDRVVVGSGDGKLYVLDLATGKKVWEFEAGAGFTASPAVAGGRIVIGDTDGRIYAFGG